MCSERIAREKYRVFFDIGIHGVGPVQIGQDHETQGLVSQTQCIVFFDRKHVEVGVNDILQKIERRLRCDHDYVRILFDQFRNRSGMVRFGMVHDDVVDIFHIDDFIQFRDVLVVGFQFRSLDDRGFLGTFKHIGVVGRTEFSCHNNIETA